MIAQTPYMERPRERCLSAGADALSVRECLAIVLGTGPKAVGCLGLASHLLEGFGAKDDLDDEVLLFHVIDRPELLGGLQCKGLGPVGRSRLLALFSIARRYVTFRLEN